jgi:hypothetical protein
MKAFSKKTSMVFFISCLLFFVACTGNQTNKTTTTTEVTTSSTEPPQPTTTFSTTTTLPGSDLITGLTSEGFSPGYKGYSFRIARFIYSADYKIQGVTLDVRNPDRSVVQVQATNANDGIMNELVIRFAPEYAVDDGTIQKGAVYVSVRDLP